MRVFQAFLLLATVGLLFMLPFTEAIYDFRTEERTDSFSVVTGSGNTTGHMTLLESIYDDDTSTLELSSNTTADNPTYASYDTTSRLLGVSGLAASTTRTMTVTYDETALSGFTAIGTLADRLPYFWLLILAAFIPAALIAIFLRRA